MEKNLALAIGNLFLQIVQLQTQNELLTAQLKEPAKPEPVEKKK